MVGDSRVVKIRETKVGESGWYFKHKPKSGATLKEIEKMIEEVHQDGKWIPDAVVIVGFMIDILQRVKQDGRIILKIKEEVLEESHEAYPNIKGVEQQVTKLNKLIKLMWNGVEIFWVLPYPIDFVYFNQIKKSMVSKVGPVIASEEEKKRDLTSTYQCYVHFKKLENIMKEIFGEENTMFYRVHCEATLKPTMMPTSLYMEKARDGHLGLGRVFPAGLSDGLHANPEPAKHLVEELLKKVGEKLRIKNKQVKENLMESVRPVKVFAATFVNSPNDPKVTQEKEKLEKVTQEKEKLEKVTQEKEKLEKVKQEKVNLEKEEKQSDITEGLKEQCKIEPTIPKYKNSNIQDHKEDKKKEEPIDKLNAESGRLHEEATFVELIKYPCGHVCMPAARGWWRNLKCGECGGRWSTEEDEVSVETVTTIVHHVRMKK